jgi:TetR/AcrR family transcriptional regulator, regulator of biofilm formation and stress response
VTPGADAAPQRPKPGRPSTGARERILDACLEVLKAEGYAGLSIAKVAAKAGENKGLISYHFGSKQGLIAAAGRELGTMISDEILQPLTDVSSTDEVIRGAADGLWMLMDRDERLARVYFDLNAVSVVEDDVRDVMREVKAEWRRVLSDLLHEDDDVAAVLIIAGLEGLALERIERGDTDEVKRAREMFIRAASAELS